MPQAWPVIVAFAKKVAVDVAIAIGASVVTSLISRALVKDLPDSASAKRPKKQPIPPVQVVYGEGRVPASYLLYRSVPGYALDVLVCAYADDAPIEGFQGFYFQDDYIAINTSGDPLTVSPTGPDANIVIGGADDNRYGGGNVELYWQNGAVPASAFTRIVSLSDGAWTNTDRADGAATFGVVSRGVDPDALGEIYPNYELQPTPVIRGSRCYDWRKDSTMPGGDGPHRRDDPDTWEYTTNPWVQWLHDETFVRGQDWEYLFLPALASHTAAANVCDEPFPILAGGTQPKYQAFVFYELNNPPKDLRERWWRTCDAMVIERGDGALVGFAGKYYEPTVILNEDRILDFRWARSRRDEDVVNKLVVSFLSPDHGYTEVETDPRLDAADIALRGHEKSAPFDNPNVTNNPQAQFLAHRAMSRFKSLYQGYVVVSLGDDETELEQRYLRLRNKLAPMSMWDVVVEVTGVTLDLTRRRVRFDVISADPDIDEWDPETDEGTGPGEATTPPVYGVPVPTIVTAVSFVENGGSRVRVTLVDPNRPDYTYRIRWRVTGDDDWNTEGPQSPVDAGGGNITVVTGFVPSVDALQVSVQTVGPRGVSNFSDPPEDVDSQDKAATALALYLNACDNQPSAIRQGHYYDLIRTLNDAGIWDRLRGLYLTAAHDAQASTVNMVSPAEVASLAGDPAWAAAGYLGDGVDARLDTGFDPSVLDARYTRDAAHQGVFIVGTPDQESVPVCGSTQCRIIPRNTSDQIVTRANTTESETAAAATANGHTAWVRVDSGNTRTFKDGVMVEAETSAAVDFIPGQTFWILGSDNTGGDSYSTKRVAAFHFGLDLTDGQIATLRGALASYLTAVGVL